VRDKAIDRTKKKKEVERISVLSDLYKTIRRSAKGGEGKKTIDG
jgi:hypothetical protein